MIKISLGTLNFQLSPYERETATDKISDDWIKTFVEYNLPGLSVQYNTAFTISELTDLKDKLESLYKHLLIQQHYSDIFFDSRERHFSLQFKQIGRNDIAEINIMMKPEQSAESVKVSDTFYLDQSYFPALLSGLDEIIKWQN